MDDGADLTGAVVEDHQALDRYAHAWSARLEGLCWASEPCVRSARFSLLHAGRALVGPFFVTLDLERSLVLRNHFYEGGEALYPTGELLRPEGFRYRPRPGPTIEGPVLVLGGPIDLNHYHWLLSWLARLAVAKRVGPPGFLDDPGLRVLVDERARREPFASHLRAYGLGEDRVIWRDPQEDVRLEDAWLLTLPSQNLYVPALLAQTAAQLKAWARDIASDFKGPKRIWISREALAPPKRRVANMDEVAPVLARFGVEPVRLETLSAAEQIQLFARAKFVAGVHGAGLANLIFCPPRRQALLVEKPFNLGMGLSRTFTVLAEACGLSHRMILAEPHAVEGMDYSRLYDAHHQDVVLEPRRLEQALAERLGPS